MFSGVTVTPCAVVTIMCLAITAAAPASHIARRHGIAASPHHHTHHNLRSRINDWKRSGIMHLLDVSRKSRSHISLSDVTALNKFVKASEGILTDISKYSGPHASEMSEVRSSMLEKIKMIDHKLKAKRTNDSETAATNKTATAALPANKSIDEVTNDSDGINGTKRDEGTAAPPTVNNQPSAALEGILKKFKDLEERAENREKKAEAKKNDEPMRPVDADREMAPNMPNPLATLDLATDSLLTGNQAMSPMESPMMQSAMMPAPSMDNAMNGDLRSGGVFSNTADHNERQVGSPQDQALDQLGNGMMDSNGGQLGQLPYLDGGFGDQMQGGQGMSAAPGAPAMPVMQGFEGQNQDGQAAPDPYSRNNGQRGDADGDVSEPPMDEFDRGGQTEGIEPHHHHRHRHHHRHHHDEPWDSADADGAQLLRNYDEFQPAGDVGGFAGGGDASMQAEPIPSPFGRMSPASSSEQFAGAQQASPFGGGSSGRPFEGQMDARCANWGANGMKRASIPGVNCEPGGMAGISVDEGHYGNGPRIGMMSRGGGFVASNPNAGLGSITPRLITPQAMPLITPGNAIMYNPTQRMMNPQRAPFPRQHNMMLPQMQQPPVFGDEQPQPGVFAGMKIDPADKLLADLQFQQVSANNMDVMIGGHHGFDHLHGRPQQDWGQNFAGAGNGVGPGVGYVDGFGPGLMQPSGMLGGGFRKRHSVHGRHSPQSGMFAFKKSTVEKGKKSSTSHKAKKKHSKKKSRSAKSKSTS